MLPACLYAADNTWKLLENAILEINNHNSSGLSYEELYRCGQVVDCQQRSSVAMPGCPDVSALVPSEELSHCHWLAAWTPAPLSLFALPHRRFSC